MNLAALAPADNTANIVYSAAVCVQTVLRIVVHDNTAAVACNAADIRGVAAGDTQICRCFRAVDRSIRIFTHDPPGIQIRCIPGACYSNRSGMRFCQINASIQWIRFAKIEALVQVICRQASGNSAYGSFTAFGSNHKLGRCIHIVQQCVHSMSHNPPGHIGFSG
ncbi:hypothetical protein D3C75_665310 [compost metagenome]